MIMANKSTRLRKEHNAAAMVDADTEFSMASLNSLLEEHRKALAVDLKTSLASLEAKFDSIQAAVNDHDQKIESLETNANVQDERISALEASCAVLSATNAKLSVKVSDLESRSLRNNIRIVGLLESIEGPHPTTFFGKMLVEVFGKEVLTSIPECDRAHQVPGAKPSAGHRPRPVIIRLYKFQLKNLIIREARSKRGKLQYQGTSIAIYDDYTPEVLEQRLNYREVMSELYKLGLKPALWYPARLSVLDKGGGRKILSTVGEANDLVASLRATVK